MSLFEVVVALQAWLKAAREGAGQGVRHGEVRPGTQGEGEIIESMRASSAECCEAC